MSSTSHGRLSRPPLRIGRHDIGPPLLALAKDGLRRQEETGNPAASEGIADGDPVLGLARSPTEDHGHQRRLCDGSHGSRKEKSWTAPKRVTGIQSLHGPASGMHTFKTKEPQDADIACNLLIQHVEHSI